MIKQFGPCSTKIMNTKSIKIRFNPEDIAHFEWHSDNYGSGVGPYDCPTSLVIKKDHGFVCFIFSYLDHETKELERYFQGIKFSIGKFSNRIHYFKMPEFFYENMELKDLGKILSQIPKVIEKKDYKHETVYHWKTINNAITKAFEILAKG